MKQNTLRLDGFCLGPLFAPARKTLPAVADESGGKRVWKKYRRARPAWADIRALAAFWERSRAMTAATGVQHSVDHWVPLAHPLVCGLHCEANLRILPLAENIRKSNNYWPDMWGEQPELFE